MGDYWQLSPCIVLAPAMSGLASHYCYSEPGSQGGGSQEQGGGEEPQGRAGEAEQDEDCS